MLIVSCSVAIMKVKVWFSLLSEFGSPSSLFIIAHGTLLAFCFIDVEIRAVR